MIKPLRLFTWFLVLSLGLALCAPSAALSQSQRTKVRVGYYILPGLQDIVSERGRRSGYAYEYLMAVAQVARWELEFVDAGFQECLALIEAGEIDILGGTQYTEEWGRAVLFPDIYSGVSFSTLRVAPESSLAYEDFSAFDGLTVGLQRGNSNVKALQDYSRDHNFSINIEYFDRDAEMTEALRTGRVGAILTPSVRFASYEREVARFGSRPFYFVVNRERPDLLAELNEAQNRLMASDPMFQSRLLSKYQAMKAENSLPLTFSAEERAYLDQGPIIRVAYDRSAAPIEYADPRDGTVRGVSAAILDRVAGRLGLTMQYVAAENYSQGLNLLLAGRVDVLSGFRRDYDQLQDLNLRATQPYVVLPMVMVTNPHSDSPLIAVPEGYIPEFWISYLSGGQPAVRVPGFAEGVELAAAGRVRGTIVNSYSANYLINDHRYDRLNIVAIPGYSNELALGLAPDAPDVLYSLLNKGIAGLSQAEVSGMLFASLLPAQPQTLKAFISRNPLAALSFGGSVVLVIIGALLTVLWYRGRTMKQMRERLDVDPLTGHWSIHKFRLQAEKALCDHPDQLYAMVYLDISSFKYVNDVYGFSTGDLALKNIGDYLAENLNDGEMTSRIMADNFVLMLKNDDEIITRERIEGLLRRLPNIPPLRRLQLSVKAGLYFRADRELDISIMIDRANYARGVAKHSSPAVVALYDESIRDSLRREKEVESLMRGALERGEFVPFFQPKVDIFTGRLAGAEALVRWRHPERGLVGPDQFIPLFEKNGFIVDIDFHIYEQVCAWISERLARSQVPAPISCNFSRMHISNRAFPERLAEIAARYEVPAAFLELEITETVAMDNTDSLVALMNRLQRKGFLIAIDDFGAGYSSLGLLQKLPADVLKLDRNFIAGQVDRIDRIIIEGVVKIAHSMEMSVVCEGVETRDQIDFLRSINCRLAQGFYYSRPMTVPDFTNYWAEYLASGKVPNWS